MPLQKDHLGRPVNIPKNAQRIISLCPSITETLFDLGLSDRLVGRTRFCIHPKEGLANVDRLGGTKKINYEKLDSLSPDLIIAEKEENTKEMVEYLSQNYPVYVTDVKDYESALSMIHDLGIITQTKEKATELITQIKRGFETIEKPEQVVKVLYFIWREPYMVAASDTYINDILVRMGWENIAAKLQGRYPSLTIEDIIKLDPELILLSSEPYPFADPHIKEFKKVLPQTQTHLVDGEMFSWYGSRMIKAAEYLKTTKRFKHFH